jgi:hypothetical protein
MGATALPPRMNKVVATRQASLRQLGFGNSALAVGRGQTLGLQPGSKSRSGHRVDEAVAHVRQVGQRSAPLGRCSRAGQRRDFLCLAEAGASGAQVSPPLRVPSSPRSVPARRCDGFRESTATISGVLRNRPTSALNHVPPSVVIPTLVSHVRLY